MWIIIIALIAGVLLAIFDFIESEKTNRDKWRVSISIFLAASIAVSAWVENNKKNMELDKNALTGEFDFDLGKPLYDTTRVHVLYGNGDMYNTLKTIPGNAFSGTRIIAFDDGYIPITFDIINYKPVISLKMWDLEGNLVVEIENNKWRRYPNSTGKFNYDSRGFEIFDNSGNLIFNIDFVSYNIIKIQGYVADLIHHAIWIPASGAIYNSDWNNPETIKAIRTELFKYPATRLFEYSGDNWLGKRLKQ